MATTVTAKSRNMFINTTHVVDGKEQVSKASFTKVRTDADPLDIYACGISMNTLQDVTVTQIYTDLTSTLVTT